MGEGNRQTHKGHKGREMNKYFLGKTDCGYWDVNYGTKEKYEWAAYTGRAKSRSRSEMQHLLDHVNKQLENKNK